MSENLIDLYIHYRKYYIKCYRDRIAQRLIAFYLLYRVKSVIFISLVNCCGNRNSFCFQVRIEHITNLISKKWSWFFFVILLIWWFFINNIAISMIQILRLNLSSCGWRRIISFLFDSVIPNSSFSLQSLQNW